jgi:hypothetical protein
MSLPNKAILYSSKAGRYYPRFADTACADLLSLRLSRGADGQTALIYENGVLTHTISLPARGATVELEHCYVEVANGKSVFLKATVLISFACVQAG